MNDRVMENIFGDEIPRIQHHLVNEFKELSGTSSNKRKRSRGTPDPDARVIALSQDELLNSENYVCDLCPSSFSRLQNLQYHLRTHNIYYLDAHLKKCSTKNYECSRCGSKYPRIDGFEIHKAACQLQGPMSNELVHISRTMSKVNDLQVPNLPTKFGPSSTSSINNINQHLRACDGFETSKFLVPEPLQPIIQMPNSSQQHSLHVDFCQEKSIWEFTD
ncbi:hypothetical protein POM88_012487 [Heracleum sosnowskyi]|uniref:C2H2-type domain-containing protein n=1 Tax=Heracleum sosnowskyi TaxID=360622 RepID=A0AAD8IZ52_9APIA|nr:hypothetical protein POM88_012487 [Heracleum sosnowskyi]